MIEIYDIHNGKLKYSAYTFWQLCEMVTEDFAYHTADEDNDIVHWIEKTARNLSSGPRRSDVRNRLHALLDFAEKENHLAFACRMSLVLGEMAFDEGQHEPAIKYFEKAVTLEPQNVAALHQLARALSTTGQNDRAVEALRKANGISASEDTYLALAEVFRKLRRPKEQERTLRSLLKNHPRSVRGMHLLAQLCRRHQKQRAAARLVQQIVDLRPEDGDNLGPFFKHFAEALIWAKYNYEARRLSRILEALDEEQQRNPDQRLSLLKAVMLYKLDKRICREECGCELRKYFAAIGHDGASLTRDLRRLAEMFGPEFSRGTARFIKNQFARFLQERDETKSAPQPDLFPSDPGPSIQQDTTADHDGLRRRANFWDGCLPEDMGGAN